jgi:hypothetical protein
VIKGDYLRACYLTIALYKKLKIKLIRTVSSADNLRVYFTKQVNKKLL